MLSLGYGEAIDPSQFYAQCSAYCFDRPALFCNCGGVLMVSNEGRRSRQCCQSGGVGLPILSFASIEEANELEGVNIKCLPGSTTSPAE